MDPSFLSAARVGTCLDPGQDETVDDDHTGARRSHSVTGSESAEEDTGFGTSHELDVLEGLLSHGYYNHGPNTGWWGGRRETSRTGVGPLPLYRQWTFLLVSLVISE